MIFSMAPPPPPPPPSSFPSPETTFVYWNAGPTVPFGGGYFSETVSGGYFPPTPSTPGFITDPFYQSSIGPSPLQQEVGGAVPSGGNLGSYGGAGYFGDAGDFDWQLRSPYAFGFLRNGGTTSLTVIATGLFVQISLWTPHAANINDRSFYGVASADIAILSEGEGFAYVEAMPYPGSYIDEGGYGLQTPAIIVTPPWSIIHGVTVTRSTGIVSPI